MLDYRDRASVTVWVVLMGLAAQKLLDLPERSITTSLLGSPITFSLTSNLILGIILGGLAASGTEAVVRAARATSELGFQERGESRGSHWIFWTLPVALTSVALRLLPAAPTRLYWLAGLIVTGGVLGLSLAGVYNTLDPFARGYRRARLGMNALTYGVALVLFLLVYRTRARSIVSATEILALSSLLALELLRGSHRPRPLIVWYSGDHWTLLGTGDLGAQLLAVRELDRRAGPAALLLQHRRTGTACPAKPHQPPHPARIRPHHPGRVGAHLALCAVTANQPTNQLTTHRPPASAAAPRSKCTPSPTIAQVPDAPRRRDSRTG